MLMLWQPLNLSYMYKHEPFKELPIAYNPSQDHDHYPPTLIFGFPISRDLREFRQIALTNGLVSPEERVDALMLMKMRLLALDYLNEQCGLKPGRKISGTGVSSLRTNYVLELKTNYRQRIPQDEMGDVIRVLKEHLPGTEPQWYLEADIDQKRIHALPSEFPAACEGMMGRLTCTLVSMLEWTRPPGVSSTYSHVIAFNEVAPFRT